MAVILPPVPTGSPPGSSFWNDWYEKLRNLVNSGAITQLWTTINFASSNITDIVSRAHANLQSLQGGTAGEYYHLTAAQHGALPVATSGTYTPTLTGVTNVAASTAYQAQYLRVGGTVTVSGRLDIDPTAPGATELGISLPIASNFGAIEDCAGTAAASGIAGQCAAIAADTANDRAKMVYVTADITNQPMYFTFSYQVI